VVRALLNCHLSTLLHWGSAFQHKNSEEHIQSIMIKLEMSSRGSCTGAVVARWWVFKEWLDPKGSDLINELIPGWLHNVINIGGGRKQEVVESRRWGYMGKVGHWWHILALVPSHTSFLCFLSTMRWAPLTCSCCHDVLPATGSESVDPGVMSWNCKTSS
jgi:hypothetical protein